MLQVDDNHRSDNNLALLKLKKALVYNDYVQPVCITSSTSTDGFYNCYMSGWGFYGELRAPA